MHSHIVETISSIILGLLMFMLIVGLVWAGLLWKNSKEG